MEENISMRGNLIKIVLEQLFLKKLWDNNDMDEKFIKDVLNEHLSFNVDIKLSNKINCSLINVYFEDESGEKRAVDFTIIPKLSIFKDVIYA
jgi:hypothetical protein